MTCRPIVSNHEIYFTYLLLHISSYVPCMQVQYANTGTQNTRNSKSSLKVILLACWQEQPLINPVESIIASGANIDHIFIFQNIFLKPNYTVSIFFTHLLAVDDNNDNFLKNTARPYCIKKWLLIAAYRTVLFWTDSVP